jgi:hypothetical protein
MRNSLGFLAGGVVILAMGLGFGHCLNTCEYSGGSRVGVINKYSTRGFVLKTNEGTMAMEGQASESSTTGRTWEFSVDDDVIDGKVKQALDSMTKVKIDYSEKYWTWPWRADTDYIVTGVYSSTK